MGKVWVGLKKVGDVQGSIEELEVGIHRKDFGFGVEVAGGGWRWLEETLLWAPRQILRAEFWTLWIFWALEEEMFWNQTGAASVVIGQISALYVLSNEHGLLLMPPGGTSKCLEDFKARFCSGGDIDVRSDI